MNYKEYQFEIQSSEDFHQDLLINSLSEIGFDTFEDIQGGFKAYIPERGQSVDDKIREIADYYSGVFVFDFQVKTIAHQNWNKVWESNFPPLTINNQCHIRATFHEPRPEFEYEIIIDPKMAFGTGHHQTTALMIELMMDCDFHAKRVLDMGCGTGILAILASRMGADKIVAIDYDPICIDSSVENAILNNVNNIVPLCGSNEVIPKEKFDIILANINRNILLNQIDNYVEALNPGGSIFFSGFYEEPDLQIISEKSKSCGLIYISHKTRDNWVATLFESLT